MRLHPRNVIEVDLAKVQDTINILKEASSCAAMRLMENYGAVRREPQHTVMPFKSSFIP
jgi:hypothetical protein